MIIDTTPFDDFNLFFAWYMNIIKSKVDGYNVAMSSDEIHILFGELNKEEKDFTDRAIRKIQNIPKGIFFTNDNTIGTFASRWDSTKNKAEILYPSVTYYWLRFPSMVKALMQHEIGHIVNGDILYKSENGADYQRKHKNCINRSMDCRINQNINYQTLDYVNRCLFTFTNHPTELIVPEQFFPKCGLPLALKGKANWTYIHTNYHNVNPEPLNENEESFELKIGTYVKTTVDKNKHPVGTYGRIYDAIPTGFGVYEYSVMRITDEEIEALENDSFKFFENFTNDPIIVVAADMVVKSPTFDFNAHRIGEYEYNKDLKEIKVIQKPISQDNPPPQEGDIALAIENIGSIGEANFAMVISLIDESKKEYKLCEFSDEIQTIIGRGKSNEYFEKLNSGENLFKDEYTFETGTYLKNFILRNLSPIPKNPPPPPPQSPKDTKEIKKPKVGNVVVIQKGESKGKYGVIQDIDADGKYSIKEVSEEVAKAMVAKK